MRERLPWLVFQAPAVCMVAVCMCIRASAHVVKLMRAQCSSTHRVAEPTVGLALPIAAGAQPRLQAVTPTYEKLKWMKGTARSEMTWLNLRREAGIVNARGGWKASWVYVAGAAARAAAAEQRARAAKLGAPSLIEGLCEVQA